jgi:signal transduction histidine kinase
VTHSPPDQEVTIAVHSDGRIGIADRGRGVAPRDRDRIFDRFWRGEGRRNEGAGLGLSIVAEIMRTHGGRVTVADNPGGGTIFTLDFSPGKIV